MKTATVLGCLVALVAGPVLAQGGPRVTIDIRDATLDEAADQIGQATGVPVLTDGKIARSGIRANLTDAPLDVVMNAVCAARELGWKRLYVKTDPEKKLKGEDLGQLVRALEQIGGTSLAAYDGKTQAATVYLRDEKAPPELFADYATPDSGYQLVYLIVDLKPKPKPKEPETKPVEQTGEQTPVDRLIAQDQQALAVLRTLSPAQMDDYWARQAEQFRYLDRDLQVGYIRTGIRMFLNSDPEEAGSIFFEAINGLTPEELQALGNMYGGGMRPPPQR